MVKGLYTAWSGLVNEQNRMDVMTNNLANATTVGYKKEGTTSQSFKDVLTVKVKDSSVGLANVRPIGIRNPGVKIGENYNDFSQGSFRATGNTYDLALSGDGFFAVEVTNSKGETSTRYTRAGQFMLDKDGFLVDSDENYVLDVENKRIQLDINKDTSIKTDGRIYQGEDEVAMIQIADFEDYNYLEKVGDTFFSPVEGAKLRAGDATVSSGYLEMSNVQVVSEMVNLISITRAYESNQKIVQTYDSTLQTATTLGKLQG